ncbi:hypothetical protein RSOLAG1IB_12062 [Rhizoctonia solani AG-1 IB]|uniref:Uncharacterized protein n=1 Tax=Thanatephorus cucumeris (strain AG1-IB / isolate 7/3/14) TaxID=1108050 RepID=A0A0B7FGI9_THACB|nr:hypothetical protein RSOLAG1IB_12062 [Rhizoctonia solani AG-1 IB]
MLSGSLKGILQKRFENGVELSFGSSFEVSNVQVIKNNRLDSKYLDLPHSDDMYFYLYGTPEQEHIEHMLVVSRSVQLSSHQVSLELNEGSISAEDLAQDVIVRMDRLRESVVLPLIPPHTPGFFNTSAEQKTAVIRDSHAPGEYGPGLTETISTNVLIYSIQAQSI